MLPSHGFILAELQRLAQAGDGRTDEPSRYVGAECGVAWYALDRGGVAVENDEVVGGTMFLRVVAETAIRVAWIAGDDPPAGPDGRLAVDPVTARERTARMNKRDLMQLSGAYKAIAAVQEPSEARAETIRLLDERVAATSAEPAPSTPFDLAVSAHARKVYAAHRLCSTTIHPGALLGRVELIQPQRLGSMLDEAAFVCSAFGDAVMRALDAEDGLGTRVVPSSSRRAATP